MRRRTWCVLGSLAAAPLAAAAVGVTYQSLATRRDMAATPPPGRLVDVGGHRLHIWCAGTGSPAVILESGLGGSAFGWPRVHPEVAQFTQVCSYDRAGQGYSDAGRGPRTSARIAAELGALIDSAGIRGPVVLVGASFGGFTTRILASTRPDRVAGLVLVDASHEDQRSRFAAIGVRVETPPALAFLVNAAPFGLLRLRHQTLGADPERADSSVRRYLRATIYRSSRYRALYDETTGWELSADDVRRTRRPLAMPLVVLTAGVGPDVGRDVHLELQRDQLGLSSLGCQVVVERAGHDIAGDAPEAVVRAIRTMVEVVRAGRARAPC